MMLTMAKIIVIIMLMIRVTEAMLHFDRFC